MANKDDEFDDLDDLFGDDDDFEGMMGDNSGDRNASSGLLGDASSGLFDDINDDKLDTIAEVSKSAFKTMAGSDITSKLGNVTSSFKSEFNDAAKDIKKHTRPLVASMKKYVPEDSMFSGVMKKIDNIVGSNNVEDSGPSKEQQELEQIKSNIEGALGQQRDAEFKNRMISEYMKHNMETKREEKLASIASFSRATYDFHSEKTSAYYRKSLELQYKHLFIAKDSRDIARTGFDALTKMTDAVVKNTGLPDFVKLRSMEALKGTMRNKFQNDLIGNVFKNSDWMENAINNVKKKVKNTTATMVTGLGATNEMMDQMGGTDDLGMSKGSMGGMMAGGFVKEALGNFVGNMASKTKTGSKAIDSVNRLMMDPTSFLKASADGTNNKAGKGILNFLSSLTSSGEITGDIKLSKESLNDNTIFDVRTKDSIVKVIPGLLSKIHAEVRSIRTGEEVSELKYNFTKGIFGSSEEFKGSFKADIKKNMHTKGMNRDVLKLAEDILGDSKKSLSKEEMAQFAEHVYTYTLTNDNVNAMNLDNSDFILPIFKKNKKLGTKILKSYKKSKNDKDGNLNVKLMHSMNRSLSNIKKNIGDPTRKIQGLIDNGREQDLIDMGIISWDDDMGEYKIVMSKYQELEKSSLIATLDKDYIVKADKSRSMDPNATNVNISDVRGIQKARNRVVKSGKSALDKVNNKMGKNKTFKFSEEGVSGNPLSPMSSSSYRMSGTDRLKGKTSELSDTAFNKMYDDVNNSKSMRLLKIHYKKNKKKLDKKLNESESYKEVKKIVKNNANDVLSKLKNNKHVKKTLEKMQKSSTYKKAKDDVHTLLAFASDLDTDDMKALLEEIPNMTPNEIVDRVKLLSKEGMDVVVDVYNNKEKLGNNALSKINETGNKIKTDGMKFGTDAYNNREEYGKKASEKVNKLKSKVKTFMSDDDMEEIKEAAKKDGEFYKKVGLETGSRITSLLSKLTTFITKDEKNDTADAKAEKSNSRKAKSKARVSKLAKEEEEREAAREKKDREKAGFAGTKDGSDKKGGFLGMMLALIGGGLGFAGKSLMALIKAPFKIAGVMKDLASFILPKSPVFSLLTGLGGLVTKVAVKGTKSLLKVITGMPGFIKNTAKLMTSITAGLGSMFSKAAAAGVIEKGKNFFKEGWEKTKGVFNSAKDGIKSAWKGIKSGAVKAWDKLSSFTKSGIEKLTNAGKWIVKSKGQLKEAWTFLKKTGAKVFEKAVGKLKVINVNGVLKYITSGSAIAKVIPALGLIIGTGTAIYKLSQGDTSGAAFDFAMGLTATFIPGGSAIALAAIAANETLKATTGKTIYGTDEFKASENKSPLSNNVIPISSSTRGVISSTTGLANSVSNMSVSKKSITEEDESKVLTAREKSLADLIKKRDAAKAAGNVKLVTILNRSIKFQKDGIKNSKKKMKTNKAAIISASNDQMALYGMASGSDIQDMKALSVVNTVPTNISNFKKGYEVKTSIPSITKGGKKVDLDVAVTSKANEIPSAGDGGRLTGDLKTIAFIVRTLETRNVYNKTGILKDGAGISFGAYQFTEKSGSLYTCLVNLKSLKPNYLNELNIAIGLFKGSSKNKYTGNKNKLMSFLREIGGSNLAKIAQDRTFTQEYYKKALLLAKKYSKVNPGVVLHVIDMYHNAGRGGAIAMLKGMSGDDVGSASNSRMVYYRSLSKWSSYGKGWRNRVKHVNDMAEKYLGTKAITGDLDTTKDLPEDETNASSKIGGSEDSSSDSDFGGGVMDSIKSSIEAIFKFFGGGSFKKISSPSSSGGTTPGGFGEQVEGKNGEALTDMQGTQLGIFINALLSAVGNPYKWGEESLETGADCSGLVYAALNKAGFKIGRTTAAGYWTSKKGQVINKLEDLKIGDSVFFRNKKGSIHHIATVTGFATNGVPIITHAKCTKCGTLTEPMSKRYIGEFIGGKRWFKSNAAMSKKIETDGVVADKGMEDSNKEDLKTQRKSVLGDFTKSKTGTGAPFTNKAFNNKDTSKLDDVLKDPLSSLGGVLNKNGLLGKINTTDVLGSVKSGIGGLGSSFTNSLSSMGKNVGNSTVKRTDELAGMIPKSLIPNYKTSDDNNISLTTTPITRKDTSLVEVINTTNPTSTVTTSSSVVSNESEFINVSKQTLDKLTNIDSTLIKSLQVQEQSMKLMGKLLETGTMSKNDFNAKVIKKSAKVPVVNEKPINMKREGYKGKV